MGGPTDPEALFVPCREPDVPSSLLQLVWCWGFSGSQSVPSSAYSPPGWDWSRGEQKPEDEMAAYCG